MSLSRTSQLIANTGLHLALLHYSTVRVHHNLALCPCSHGPPGSSGPLVQVEVSGHPHHGHRAHVCLCRSCHREHPAHTKPAQRLSGQDMHLSTLRQFFIWSFPSAVLTFSFVSPVFYWGNGSRDGS